MVFSIIVPPALILLDSSVSYVYSLGHHEASVGERSQMVDQEILTELGIDEAQRLRHLDFSHQTCIAVTTLTAILAGAPPEDRDRLMITAIKMLVGNIRGIDCRQVRLTLTDSR
jgi:hypothetical protein